MTITNNDIKVYQAQDNSDNDSGGGSRTSVEVVDGQVNNLFPDISRIDTVSGDVALRKVFPTVDTTNRDVYYGAHAMIRKPPGDPKVSSLLFFSDDPHDKRAEVRDKIESYVTASYQTDFYLFGNHVTGARSVTFLQKVGASVPEIGEVYLLREVTGEEQYIRVIDVDITHIVLTYTGSGNAVDYTRQRIICTIDQPLWFAFTGSEFDPTGRSSGAAYTYATQVSDAAKFYGVKGISNPLSSGDLTLKVDSIYEYLVPASKQQVPLVNVGALSSSKAVAETTNTVRRAVPTAGGIGSSIDFPDSIVPGSFDIASSHYDDGNGNYVRASDGYIVGSIDYVEGVFTLVANLTFLSRATYEVATSITVASTWTDSTEITSINQGLIYVISLAPVPSLMNLVVDYRTGGKWYRMNMNSDYSVGDSPSIGVGVVNNNGDGTASLSLTLGALPDIGSTIIVSWGSSDGLSDQTNSITRVYDIDVKAPAMTSRWLEIDLGTTDIDPGSFTFTLTRNTSLTSVITVGPDGRLVDTTSWSNKIEGFFNSTDGKVIIEKPEGLTNSRWPAPDTAISFTCDYFQGVQGTPSELKTATTTTSKTTGSSGVISYSLGEAVESLTGIKVVVSLAVPVDQDEAAWDILKIRSVFTLVADSSGVLRVPGETTADSPSSVTGVVDLTGNVTLYTVGVSIKRPKAFSSGYNTVVEYATTEGASISTYYRSVAIPSSATLVPRTVTGTLIDLASYKIQLPPGVSYDISFRFLNIGSVYSDYDFYSEGDTIFREGEAVGSINRDTGLITLKYLASPALISPRDLEIEFDRLFIDSTYVIRNSSGIGSDLTIPANKEVAFRTSATKLTSSSLQLKYKISSDGVTNIATTDSQGVVTGPYIFTGECDFETGVVTVTFNADVLVDSLTYDAVAETSIPVDPDLLGLNPVRLPVNGLVPIYDEGRHLVIFNEASTPTLATAGLSEILARQNQSYIEVIDSNGLRLAENQYVADKATGVVTFNDPISLVDKYGIPLTGPFTIVDRIEDMVLATKVQVDGTIDLSAAVTNDYPVLGTKVASSLVWGDTGARVYNLFSQEIWSSGNPVWSDIRIGDPTTAQYDEVNYPLQIDNRSSVSGRWAIIFKSSTVVDVVEEKMGVVEAGVSIAVNDVAPINIATGAPYFVMLQGGFGSGWVTNNVIRFNTDSGDNNMWVIRVIQPGALSELTDAIEVEVRGDAS